MPGEFNNFNFASISVVVPVYGGEKTIEELLQRINAVLFAYPQPYEIILVSDASPDSSREVIQRLLPSSPWLRYIELMNNAGQHNATLCGIRAARFDVIVTMDDDLQHPPEDIPKMLAAIEQGHDLVYSVPLAEVRSPLRNALSLATKRVILGKMSGIDFEISSFRAFRTELRKYFNHVAGHDIYLDLLLSWGSRSVGNIRSPHMARTSGKSGYTRIKLIRHALNMLTSYSVFPLYLASWLGFLMTIFGMIILGITLTYFIFYGRTAPGFTFLASAMAIFSGAQLLSIGILGLYVARIYRATLSKPSYIIKEERTGGDTDV